jgi:3-methyladenine DNA glycosylase AlkD
MSLPGRRAALPASARERLAALRATLAALADAEHAAFHRAYHKSALRFLGLRTPQLRAVWRGLWPGRQRVTREEALALIDPLWDSGCFEEATTAIYLLSRVVGELTPADLPLLLAQTRRCAGWGHLDFLALEVLGPLALAQGPAVYAPVTAWLDDGWLWTRRAAILIHCVPARRGRLDHSYAWPSFAARLHETEFFIRKAIGWALRECCKRYPEEVAGFVKRQAAQMSGLTFREATRNLPPGLRLGLERPGR